MHWRAQAGSEGGDRSGARDEGAVFAGVPRVAQTPIADASASTRAPPSIAGVADQAGAAQAAQMLHPPPPVSRTRGMPQAQSASNCLLPNDPDVPGLDVGYGPGGASVQRADLKFLHDREVMQKTLLRGDPVITASAACDVICSRSSRAGNPEVKRKRVSLLVELQGVPDSRGSRRRIRSIQRGAILGMQK